MSSIAPLLDDTELVNAYLAGCMDSDGCFTMVRRKGPRRPSYRALLILGQVTPQVPHLLEESYGGSVCISRHSGGRQSQWRWQASGESLKRAVDSMRTFLRIKGAQADLLTELRESQDRSNMSGGSSRPDWVCDWQDALYNQLRALNSARNDL